MASWMMAPSHFLKQCGLIIKLINKVLQHLSQWIITKDLKIPISKMRLKLVGLDNFNSSPEIINSFSSDNSFLCFMVVSWYLMSPSLILLASVYSKGTRYPPHVSFVTTPQGAMSQEHTCYMRSQSHERSWPPLLKLKFGNGWLTSKCCSSSCKKNSIPVFNSNSNSNSRDFNSNSIFNSTNSNSGIGIGIDLQFQFRNWIDPNPAYNGIGSVIQNWCR